MFTLGQGVQNMNKIWWQQMTVSPRTGGSYVCNMKTRTFFRGGEYHQ